jgi:hypothetical protein
MKKKGDFHWDFTTALIVGILVLVLGGVIYAIITGKMGGWADYFQNAGHGVA